ncbi:hypothetical protein QBC42DRAFT_284344 [Cladorrhinum samala]|uniref:Uncharacterized protein n=1 Tax=Cladorrhinum samala TaxID=585594 RepID=A0AAV9HUJ3_9PEZI|nr:hypothetical protein QBC42DRAFT_284344 [Cladorrhinum samala]
MQLSSIITALLLPLLAVAEETSTVTATSTVTLTRTVTLQRAQVTGLNNGTWAGTTATISSPVTTTTGAPIVPSPDNAAGALGAANVAAVAVAGVVVAAFL